MSEFSFPWAYFVALEWSLKDYRDNPTIDNLNHLHLTASILYAKLSTFTMHQNAGKMVEGETWNG